MGVVRVVELEWGLEGWNGGCEGGRAGMEVVRVVGLELGL